MGNKLTPRARGGLARGLLLVLLPLVVGPLVIFALFTYRQVQTDSTTQINAQLSALGALKENQINDWATSRVVDINNLALSPDVVQLVRDHQAGAGMAAMASRLNQYLSPNGFYEAVLLARPQDGVVEFAAGQPMYARLVGTAPLDSGQLVQARQAALMLPPVFDAGLNQVRVLIAAPVVDPAAGKTLALIYGFVRQSQLLDLITPLYGLGRTGRAFAVTADGHAFGNPATTPNTMPDSLGIRLARNDHQTGNAVYTNELGQQVFGDYRWLPTYQMAIIVEENTAEALAGLSNFTSVLIAVSLGAIGISVLGVIYFTRGITQPLHSLTEVAMRMAAGDLTTAAPVKRRDELGLLAEAFNTMGAELSGLTQDLERRVEARTQQLATAAEVGRAATSILSTDELLRRTVELIRDRFGYYHVSVFLLDATGRWALLSESTGAVGAQLKARGYRLGVGSNSLIGWVTGNRRPRIALDVGGDEVYSRNELLPDTRSEAALPLRLGERLIGALDVQSRSLNAFNQSDIEVLQVLADQIAVAVENGRLFSRQTLIAELEQRVASLTAKIHAAITVDDILTTASSELGQVFGARKVVIRLAPEAEGALRDTSMHGQARQKVYEPHPGDAGTTLDHVTQPVELALQLRDRSLGAIEIYGRSSQGWTDEERAALGTVAAQISAELEGAALLEETRARAQQLATLSEVTANLAGPQLSTQEALNQIARGALSLFGADGAAIWLPADAGPDQIELRVSYSGDEAQPVGRRLKIGEGLAGGVFASGQARRMDNYTSASGSDPTFAGVPNYSALAAPMLWQGQAVGVLTLTHSPPEHGFTAGEERIALLFGSQAASALENSRLLAETQQRLTELAAINRISETLTAHLDIGAFLKLVGDEIFAIFGVRNGYVALYNSRTTEIEFPYFLEAGEPQVVTARPLGQGLTSIVIQTRRPLLINSDSTRRAAELGALVQGAPAKSWLGVPITAGDDIIGALSVQDTDVEGLFGESDIRLLSTIAANLGVAISNARLFQETRRRSEQLATAAEVSRTAISVLNPDELVRQSVELIRDRFAASTGVYYAALFLIDETQQWARLRHATGEAGRVLLEREHKLEVGGASMVGWATANGRPRIALDVGADSVRFANPLLPETRSELALPLMVGEVVLGALDVQSTVAGAFAEADVAVLQTMTDQIAIALRNAQLMSATQSTQNFLNSVVENLPVTLFVKNAGDLSYVRWNRAGEELLGYTRDERIGKTDYDFYPPETAAVMASDDRRVLDGLTLVDVPEEPVETRHRGPRLLHTRKIPILDETGRPEYLLGLSEDITERKQAETALKAAQQTAQRRAELLAAAAEIGRVMTASLDRDELLRTAVNLIRERFGFYHASIFTVDPGATMALLREATGEAGLELKARRHQLGIGSRSLVGTATATRRPVVVQDVRIDPTHLKNPLLPDTRAEAVVPLLSGDLVVGALDVQSTLPNAFGEDDVAILITIADQLAVALQNARLFDQTARQARRESLVFEITSKIRASPDVDTMLRTAVTELRTALGVSGAVVRVQIPGGPADDSAEPAENQSNTASATTAGATTASTTAVTVAGTAPPRHGTSPLSGNGNGHGGRGANGSAAAETGPNGSGV